MFPALELQLPHFVFICYTKKRFTFTPISDSHFAMIEGALSLS